MSFVIENVFDKYTDPATLARDCRVLAGRGYEIRKVAVVDQFAHSVHVETGVHLINQNAKAKHHVNIGVDAEDYYKIKDSVKSE